MIRGRIKSLKKTYGFIAGEDGQDYFFYWAFMAKDNGNKTFNQLTLGNIVDFDASIIDGEKDEKKYQAKNIRVVD